ncbi:hypothetical protein JMJ55_08525 [Belnapia sp. T6]|uniref:Uncharacterized protein n=1 Tax=Belnapia mucosa TaxID=2804532 RepID=A0ABS1V4Y2_9PROT|nr:hypothetical protein [Belnapia mucosa]MBL6455363.1 hypothetical protein [Belnapia mucosa]
MTPTEREQVKTDLQAYVAQHGLSIHDLAARMKSSGRKVDAKVLHRFLDRGLLVDDTILSVYRGFVDQPG